MATHLTPLHIRVQTAIRQHRLLQKGQRLLLGVSGGQDSLCLFQILQDLAPRWDWQIFVLHCDHRWTPDETRCAQFLQSWFQEQEIPYALETADPITLDEHRARQWRYQCLEAWALTWQCSAVLTAHTGSDQVETFLFNLMRGTGPQGLTSLSWSRPLRQDHPNSPQLVRPMLKVWRHETASFCHDLQLPVWPDQTNQDLHHPRNRIRHELIPYLQKHFNPQVEAALSRTATLVGAEHAWVEAQSQQLWPQLYCKDPVGLHRPPLQQCPLALQRQILFTFLCHHLCGAPSFDQVEVLLRLVSAPRRSQTPPFPGGGWARVEDDWIRWHEEAE